MRWANFFSAPREQVLESARAFFEPNISVEIYFVLYNSGIRSLEFVVGGGGDVADMLCDTTCAQCVTCLIIPDQDDVQVQNVSIKCLRPKF